MKVDKRERPMGFTMTPDFFSRIDIDLEWWLFQIIIVEANRDNTWTPKSIYFDEYKPTIDRLIKKDVLVITDNEGVYKLNPEYIQMKYSDELQ